jgi:hypothetical protein
MSRAMSPMRTTEISAVHGRNFSRSATCPVCLRLADCHLSA